MYPPGWQQRLIVILVAGALLSVSSASLAHATAHHDPATEADCATCRWVKSASVMIDGAPAQDPIWVASDVPVLSQSLPPEAEPPARATRGPPLTLHA